jgi:hypothetical protein
MLVVPQLVKNLHVLYRIGKFIIVFIIVRDCILC